METNPYKLLGKWLLEEFGPTVEFPKGIVAIRQVPPVLGHVFTHRFKVETATFDGTGNNPHDKQCIMVHIVEDRVSIVEQDCNQVPEF